MSKNTKTRQAVLEILANEKTPLSVKDICAKLNESGFNIWLSTIYRLVDTLENEKLISRIFSDDKKLYVINKDEHSHYLICVSCKKMKQIFNCPVHNFEKSISTQYDFEIINHRLEYFGYCNECKTKF